jgi:hypothetical protein
MSLIITCSHSRVSNQDEAYAGLKTEELELSGPTYTIVNQIVIITTRAVEKNLGLISSAESRYAPRPTPGLVQLFDCYPPERFGLKPLPSRNEITAAQ